MRRAINTSTLRIATFLTVALILVGVLTYLNYRLAISSPGGVDFLTHWVGTRTLLEGESPYSDEAAVRVQNLYYGRLAQPGENEFLDCYALYIELIFLPFALISDYALARAAWMTFLGISSMAAYIISLRVVGWRPGRWALAAYLVYAAIGYETVRPVINGNVTPVIALILVSAILAIQNRRDAVGGVLLAVALGKPNLTIVPVVLLLAWSLSLNRWRFPAWFAASMAVLVIAGLWIIPDWPLQNLSTILRYTSYNPPSTLAAIMDYYLPGAGRWIGNGISVLLTIFLTRAWIRSGHADFDALLPVLCITLVASQWLWISTGPGNFIILALPTAQLLKLIETRRNGRPLAVCTLGVLLCGLWILFLLTIDRARGNFQSPMMFIPLPLFLMAALAWGRKPPQPSLRVQQSG